MRAKKHKSCCILMHVYIYMYNTYIYIYDRIRVNCAFTYDDLFQQHGCVNIIVLSYETVRNSSASVIYIAIAGISESTSY